MGRRYYRRRGSMAGEMIRDTAYIGNRLSWRSSAIFGVVLFSVFYWLLPWWIQAKLTELQSNMFRPMLEAVFGRRIHWLQYLGIALGLICLFFSIRNYFSADRMNRSGEATVGWLSRLLAKLIN